ncbi:MAG: Eco57I restriction-modification methylase domain-containing protein, partial [Luteolibacter sp.]
MPSLRKDLRKDLGDAIVEARDIAEAAATAALQALAVDQPKPFPHMDADARALRNRLRERGRAAGDVRNDFTTAQTIGHLAQLVGYEHWHRMLFARFLAENGLLLEPAHQVALSLADVEELAREEGADLWQLAGSYAQRMLPEVFRNDDPALEVTLAREDRVKLEKLLADLDPATFTADDSLGWTYQFWQTKRKGEVNASGVKIGADEISPVTQLFTEDYMVDFLLDNTLGAWHAGKVLAANPTLAETARSEDELRQACALPGCEWKYLRFVQGSAGVPPASLDSEGGQDAHAPLWTPAAGTFPGWPKTAADLKCLDPCMGSGHFVVAMFERLVALRMAEENLDEPAAVLAVIRDNLFGLEIDPRCTQIAAFNLALAAWRRVGHCKLPPMNLACSGLAPNTPEKDWLAMAGDNDKLRRGMERLYRLFQNAPVLGSLINPRAGEGDLLEAAFHELQPLLEKALKQETQDDSGHEMVVTAHGLAKAAEILAGQFTLVATNVPYLGRPKQDDVLMDYCERVYPEAKSDLATCFVDRCVEFCSTSGSTALVTPQNWMFLGSYKRLREKLLGLVTWDIVGRLGPKAFQTPMWDFNICLLSLTRRTSAKEHRISGLDAAVETTPEAKSLLLREQTPVQVGQANQLKNPDARLVFVESQSSAPLLNTFVECYQGVRTGDRGRFVVSFWEVTDFVNTWEALRNTSSSSNPADGITEALRWEKGRGQLHEYAAETRDKLHDMHESGNRAWGHRGVGINQMANLKAYLYFGEKFDGNVNVIYPLKDEVFPALWAFCSSPEYEKEVRNIDQKLAVTNATLVKVPFDFAHWQKVAAEKYPHGLPKPFSSDPTQWLFDGKVARPSRSGSGRMEPDRDGLATLQVAVARLLGYRWPRQTGSSFPDCPALGPDGLESFADEDGIVCLPPLRGEAKAAARLHQMHRDLIGA